MADYSLGRSHLTWKIKLGYGVGHVLNDLCASMWFTYLLVYLQYVMRLNKGLAGFLLLLGQVADAISTPLVGLHSDNGFTTECCRYGRRKTWHAIGTVCVLCSFPFIFIMCQSCNLWWPSAYVFLLGFMIIIFQFGWASTQVAHLAMIPDLSPNEEDRDELNIIRYFFDMSSDVLVYLITWIVFETERSFFRSAIDPTDSGKFKTITISIVVIGAVFSILFHIFTPEAPQRKETLADTTPLAVTSHPTDDDSDGESFRNPSPPLGIADGEDLSLRINMTWRDWLKEPQFYQIALIYTCARLVANLSNIFMPIYLQETVRAREDLIALIPLVMSVSGATASVILRVLRKCTNKRISMVIAILIGIISAIISSVRGLPEWGVYITAVLWGLSGSIMIILSLAFTADLIGYCTESAAFVYGCMSFWDKLANGLVVFLIQELTRTQCFGDDCSLYYRKVMSIGLLIPLLMSLASLGIIASTKLGRTRKMRRMLCETVGSNEGTPVSSSSDSSEFLIATDSKMGYGALAKL